MGFSPLSHRGGGRSSVPAGGIIFPAGDMGAAGAVGWEAECLVVDLWEAGVCREEEGPLEAGSQELE